METYYIVTDNFDNLIARYSDEAMAIALITYLENEAMLRGIPYFVGELFIVNEFVYARVA